MSLSDCERCWDTPCRCGYNWRHYSSESINNLITTLQKVKLIQFNYPDLSDDEWKKKLNE